MLRQVVLLQGRAGSPPHRLHRHTPPGQRRRSGRSPLARRAAQPACWTPCGRLTSRSWPAMTPSSSVHPSGRDYPAASTNWPGSIPCSWPFCDLGFNPAVKFHSIIADMRDPPRRGGTDGVVPYASSHLDGASSELIVPAAISARRTRSSSVNAERILKEHLASQAVDPARHRWATRADASRRLSVQAARFGPAGAIAPFAGVGAGRRSGGRSGKLRRSRGDPLGRLRRVRDKARTGPRCTR